MSCRRSASWSRGLETMGGTEALARFGKAKPKLETAGGFVIAMATLAHGGLDDLGRVSSLRPGKIATLERLGARGLGAEAGACAVHAVESRDGHRL